MMAISFPNIRNGSPGFASSPDRRLFIVFGSVAGMAPATFACVFVSALGDRDSTWKSALILAVLVTVFGVHCSHACCKFRCRLDGRGEGCDGNRADGSLVRLRRRARAAEPMYCFLGVLIGNMVGVLPGMGPLATISILLPLTFGIKPVGAILMLAGIFYGSQYGGAICHPA